jgi:catechol 2,3-dioxygenase-like lactoylglutathione lyase family enzyme
LWFQAGATQIHLILESAATGPAGFKTPADSQASRNHHFAFEVDDCYAATERLKELELPIVGGPKQRPDGAVQVYVTDPDGHVVELFSLPPA